MVQIFNVDETGNTDTIVAYSAYDGGDKMEVIRSQGWSPDPGWTLTPPAVLLAVLRESLSFITLVFQPAKYGLWQVALLVLPRAIETSTVLKLIEVSKLLLILFFM